MSAVSRACDYAAWMATGSGVPTAKGGAAFAAAYAGLQEEAERGERVIVPTMAAAYESWQAAAGRSCVAVF